MTDSLRGRCELLVENQKIMRKRFKLENSAIHTICASIYASERAILNPDKILYCIKLIKKKTSVLSQFRSVSITPIATMLSLDKDIAEQLTNTLKVYSALRLEFAASAYLPAVAYTMAKYSYSAAVRVRRSKQIYKSMKAHHPFIVSSDDTLYAALLAARGYSEDRIEKAYNECLDFLKGLFSRNSIQTISNILLLGEGDTKCNCTRVKGIYEELRKKGFKYGKSHEMAILAALAFTEKTEEELADMIIEINNYLKQHSGFGWTMGRRLRLMYAAFILCSEYSSTEKAVTYGSAVTQVTSIVLAEQAALASSISASTFSICNSTST